MRAVEFLKQDNLVGIPTETVYGLAGNAFSEEAVLKIFTVKNRPAFDPLIVHVASSAQAKLITQAWPDWAERLSKQYWPGPLTLLLPKKKTISDLVTSGSERVALRIPAHALTQQLLQQIPFPLVAPSANPFGYVSPTSAMHVNKQLGGKIPYILDGGECMVGLESTIVGEDEFGVLTIYRAGGLSIEELENFFGRELNIQASSSRPEAPGMLLQHYAPLKKLMLWDGVDANGNEKCGGIFFSEKVNGIASDKQLLLSERGDMREAAANLYAYLRLMDEREDIEVVYTAYVPEQGLGRAINDRLRRALS